MGGKQSFPRISIPNDRVFIVTGANRGIGYETAKWIAMLGGRVILACRSEDGAMQAMRQMGKDYHDEKTRGTPGLVDAEELAVEFMQLELDNFRSVKAFAENFRKSGHPLHALICNAGVSKAKPVKTEDGFEAMLQINYLSHFLLIGQLLPIMKNSGNDVRIVLVSSDGHRMCRLNMDTINYTGPEEKFSYFDYYGRSKLYQVMQMHSLCRRLRNSNVTVTCAHPGMVETNLRSEFKDYTSYKVFETMGRMIGVDFAKTRAVTMETMKYLKTLKGARVAPGGFGFRTLSSTYIRMMKTPAEGATTVINCAINPELAGTSGVYYKDCKEGTMASVSKDETKQEELWILTMKYLVDHFTEDEVYCLEGADP